MRNILWPSVILLLSACKSYEVNNDLTEINSNTQNTESVSLKITQTATSILIESDLTVIGGTNVTYAWYRSLDLNAGQDLSKYQLVNATSAVLDTVVLGSNFNGLIMLKVHLVTSLRIYDIFSSPLRLNLSAQITPTPTRAPTPTPISGGTAADQSFSRRCSAPGVLRCNGFDSAADLARPENHIFYENTDPRGKILIDSAQKASGAGSLRFDVPENATSARLAPPLDMSFGQNFGPRNLPRFATRNKLYIQFRQRFTKEWTFDYLLGRQHFKQITINGGGSCGDESIVTENSGGRGFPVLYSDCGSEHLIAKEVTNDNRNGYTLYQQGDYYCSRFDTNNNDYSRCAMYESDQWITYYYEIEFGDEDINNTVVRAYVKYGAGPMLQFIDFKNLRVNADRDTGPQQYNTLSILPYITQKSEPNEAATTWYDEVIISSQPIAAP